MSGSGNDFTDGGKVVIKAIVGKSRSALIDADFNLLMERLGLTNKKGNGNGSGKGINQTAAVRV